MCRALMSSGPAHLSGWCRGPAGVPLPTSPCGLRPALWDYCGVGCGPSLALNLRGSAVTRTGDLPVLLSRLRMLYVNPIRSG